MQKVDPCSAGSCPEKEVFVLRATVWYELLKGLWILSRRLPAAIFLILNDSE